MSRNLKKNKFFSLQLSNNLIIMNKSFIILSEYINKSFKIHNGKNFTLLKIVPKMVNYKFGEFILTKKHHVYKKKLKKNK